MTTCTSTILISDSTFALSLLMAHLFHVLQLINVLSSNKISVSQHLRNFIKNPTHKYAHMRRCDALMPEW